MKLLPIFFFLFTCFCGPRSENSNHVSKNERADPPQTSTSNDINKPYIPDQFGERLGDFQNIEYVNDNTLSYQGYEVHKRTRKTEPDRFVIEYAVLMKDGKVIFSFDDSSLDQISSTQFGLSPLLGNGAKQLIVKQTSDKIWRYWIVKLQPEFKVIYDSGIYDVVYDLRTIDADGDGRFEVIQHLGAFWYFHGLDNLYSPRPPIIFRYETVLDKYVPANSECSKLVLKDIEQRIDKVRGLKQEERNPAYHARIRGAILDIMLRYLYAGKGMEAWAFFEQEYNIQSDKDGLKIELKGKLKSDTLYKEITRKMNQ